MCRRALVIVLGLLLVAVLAPGSAAADPPRPAAVPGGLPAGRQLMTTDRADGARAAADSGNCSATDVHCKPALSGSCTGNVRQDVPPATIRVLTGTTAASIKTVDFHAYVEDSLYNEWVPTWNGDAVKAGAVAVKSFAWYWATHYGGYVSSTPNQQNCFDITPDTAFFQAYVADTGSKDAKTVQRVAATWPVAVRSNGDVVEAHYQKSLSNPNEPCGYDAGGTPDSYMSQYGTQACSTLDNSNNGYRYNVILKLYYGNSIDLSTTAQLRTQHDFTFVAKSTGGTFNGGAWYLADGYPTTFSFGQKGDVPFTATTGDGFATAADWRPASHAFYVANALHGVARTVSFGAAGDVPVADHYQGSAAPTQLAVFRPGSGTWYLAAAGGAIAASIRFGQSGDVPVPGNWLSETADSIAVFRPANGTWYVRGGATVRFGQRGDVAAPADYNGDGRTDITVYRPSNSTFYRGSSSLTYGTRGDVPVTGDFTGDGKADFAVYRPSNHLLYVRGLPAPIAVAAGTPIGAAPFRG